MSNVVSLDDYRWKKRGVITGLSVPVVSDPETAAYMKIVENRIGFYDLVNSFDDGSGTLATRYGMFVLMMDEYEEKATETVRLHFLYKKGCRPGQMLELRCLKDEVVALRIRILTYWGKPRG
jgi:hypothetical protein